MRDAKTRTLPAAIANAIRAQILEGAYPAGHQLRQDALARDYDVSRIPVREALIQLEAEGLVKIVPHKGAVVAPLSVAEVRDVFDLRLMLEVRLFAASIPLLTAEDLATVDAIQTAFDRAIDSADAADWGRLNARLHMALYSRAPMPRTAAIVAGLLQTSERYTRLQMTAPDAWHRARTEHAALIALAATGEVAAGGRALHDHIAAVRDDLLAIITARGVIT